MRLCATALSDRCLSLEPRDLITKIPIMVTRKSTLSRSSGSMPASPPGSTFRTGPRHLWFRPDTGFPQLERPSVRFSPWVQLCDATSYLNDPRWSGLRSHVGVQDAEISSARVTISRRAFDRKTLNNCVLIPIKSTFFDILRSRLCRGEYLAYDGGSSPLPESRYGPV